jgi:hypothetical protein
MCLCSSSLIWGRVAVSALGFWSLLRFSFAPLQEFLKFSVLVSPFPFSCGFVENHSESFWYGFYLGLICGEVGSLDHCVRSYDAVLGRDLSRFLFEFVFRKPQQNPITLKISDLWFDFLFVWVHTSLENFFYPAQTICQIWDRSGHFCLPGTVARVCDTIGPQIGTAALTSLWFWL